MAEINHSYVVYIHTCPNGKRYVGTTSIKPEYRWNKGRGYARNERFFSDIVKYGWDNIAHEIVHTGLSKDDAAQAEIELIARYKTNNESFGYNLTDGGFQTCGASNPFYGKKHTDASRESMRKHWDYDKHFTKETRHKISMATSGENNPLYGKHHTAESNLKNLQSQKTRKVVVQLTLFGEIVQTFQSIREAARAVNGCNKHISNACKYGNISYGYKWQFAEKAGESNNELY